VITQSPCSSAHSPIALTSVGEYTVPVGLLGDTNISAFVWAVSAASSWGTVTRKPFSSVVGSATGVPSASAIASGYVVQ
jgi:hypothetical protein